MTEHASAVARATQLETPEMSGFVLSPFRGNLRLRLLFLRSHKRLGEVGGGLNLARRFLLQKGLANEAVEIHFGDQIRVKLVMHRL